MYARAPAGIVGVDYNECSIEILMDIPFEPRKEPDTSAEFVEDQKEKVARGAEGAGWAH